MKKLVSISLLTLVLIAGLAWAFDIQQVLAEQREVGVEVGDWAKYDVTVNYTTNDPDPPVPPPPLGVREIEYYKAEVESVSGTNITFQVTIRFNNGTLTSWRSWTDVASTLGQSFPSLFIAANLSAGDTIYTEPSSPVINATLTCRYVEAERKVNYFVQKSNYTSHSFQQVLELHLYWDRATGIIDEWIDEREYTRLEQGYVTYMFTRVVIKETNIWAGEEEKTLLGMGWGRMRIAPREHVYGRAELYKIGGMQIELAITCEGKTYSRTWSIIWHEEYKYSVGYLCYSREWGFLIVGLHEHGRWQPWWAFGKSVVAFGFPLPFGSIVLS